MFPVAAMIGGALLGAYASYQQGQAEQDAAKFNAEAARQNAIERRQQAEEDAIAYRVVARRELGSARANYGASGLAMDGSALDVLEDSARTAEQDVQNIRTQGEREARAMERGAAVEDMRGRTARTNAQLGVASALLTGGARAYGMR